MDIPRIYNITESAHRIHSPQVGSSNLPPATRIILETSEETPVLNTNEKTPETNLTGNRESQLNAANTTFQALPEELSFLIQSWESLPANIQEAILVLIKPYKENN